MDYCGPAGIPHSVFLGRVVAPDEPYWLPEDRRKVLEWQGYKSGLCGKCGVYRPAWMDDRGKELEDPPFEVVEFLCPGCQELELYNEEKREKRKGVHLGFRRVKVEED